MWSRILALLVWLQLCPFCQCLRVFLFFFPNSSIVKRSSLSFHQMCNSTQVLYSHIFALVLVCPHIKESFEMNDLHNTRCIHFTFHSNISYVAPRPSIIKGPTSSHKCTHTWKDPRHTSHTNTPTQRPPPPQAWLHQDDSRPLSPRDKDSVSWDDVTAAFLMRVNLCLAEQQQKNLCVALNPHLLPRIRTASALFSSSMWLSLLTFSPLSLSVRLLSNPTVFFLILTVFTSLWTFLQHTSWMFSSFLPCLFFSYLNSVFFFLLPPLNISSPISFLSFLFLKTLTVPNVSFSFLFYSLPAYFTLPN